MPPLSSLVKRSLYFLAIGLMAKAVLSERKNDRPYSRRKILRKDARKTLGGIKEAYLAPLQWKEKQILIAGAVACGIGILFLFDEEISRWFRRKGEKAFPILKDFGWYYGSPENHYAINGGMYLYGLILRNEEVRNTGVLLISASAAAGLFQTLAKIIIGRARPLRNEGKASFSPFSKENSYYSFPSGHSILSFTTAYALGSRFNNPILKGGIYFFGSIAPVSRLWAGAHWITDAAASLCISIPLVKSVEKYLWDKQQDNLENNRRIYASTSS